MKIKKLGLVLVSLGAIVALAACGADKKSGADKYLSKIKDKGTLTVALNPDFAPFEFQIIKDGKNEIVGSDVDLANEIGKSLGVKVKFQAMDFNNVLASVQSGKADIAVSGISATAERKKAYDFSTPYYTAKNVMIVKKSDLATYKKLSDFSGVKVAVQKGSVQENIVTDQIKGVNAVSLIKNGQMINELKNDTVSGVVFEEPIAKAYVSANPDLTIVSSIQFDSSKSDSYAIALPKDSGNLKTEVDKVIKKLKADGQIDKLVEKNFELSQNSAK
ncbi:transporter substrate-binding domain-containing protein [Lactococcus piscium]|uniref:Amino acid ABC transporter substrate-binding protein n=1 Tax=Pseudolactococcus paracarnosus TaxID=2749962 RepID=A0A7L4WBC3_9LACT|nr:transporter substrate-binding domain-containing protein [Lactococcus paracarnosus]MCJ1993712.1 transporter substrate-binding domain-containing protein [Lactococcus paracarnosus]QDJ27638.1 amino acid ABC transporter substrate-binding protein [Lactococcus paracarnosus]SPC36158.1 Amino acid ABC transporter, amino acid-binding/permease protein [Lactococcus piscium]